MTDNDIRNAIAGCVNSTVKCNECVFMDELYDGSGLCMVVALKYALDLINRQKADIERLNKKVEELSEVLSDTIRIRYAECRAVAIKDFAERLIARCGAPHWCVWMGEISEEMEEMVGEDDG
jgi:hypothetical protein